jgi:1-acyl-sn-glycerol-3-phosphate acyltransferase
MIKFVTFSCAMIGRMLGLKFVNHIEDKDLKSYVMVGAPHTSNLDFFPAMMVSYYGKMNAKFVIKQQWMRFPLKHFFQSIGAVGINRELIAQGKVSSSTDLMADLFKQHKDLVLMISPEGTRKKRTEWKTGFYYIAKKAGVPIVLAYDDWGKMEVGLGKVIYPSDLDKDMKEIAEFYQSKTGRNPEKFSIDTRYI